jgi:hypothetical protein
MLASGGLAYEGWTACWSHIRAGCLSNKGKDIICAQVLMKPFELHQTHVVFFVSAGCWCCS